jgi:hypothetical protein
VAQLGALVEEGLQGSFVLLFGCRHGRSLVNKPTGCANR